MDFRTLHEGRRAVTPMRVKMKPFSNLYVLIIHAPGDRTAIAARFETWKPWPPMAVGQTLRVDRARVRIIEIIRHVERRGEVVEHVIDVFTRAVASRRRRRAAARKNLSFMPPGDQSIVAQFIRFHVLVRVFDGNPDAWLADLRARGAADQGDIRFVRWVRSRLRQDPALLTAIRRMVDATPFWRVAGA